MTEPRGPRPALTALTIADPPESWRALGFTVAPDGRLGLGGVTLCLGGSGRGITGWHVAGAPGLSDALGVREVGAPGGTAVPAEVGAPGGTAVPAEVRAPGGTAVPAEVGAPGGIAGPAVTASVTTHANGATGVDHVVLLTPDFDATAAALNAAGLPFRRIRQASETVRQGFRRLGPAILEVVEATHAERPLLWGVVVIVDDLDAVVGIASPHVKPPRPAVQPGRRIAPVSSSAGLSAQLAFMDPEPAADRS